MKDSLKQYLEHIDRAMMYCMRHAPRKNMCRQLLREQEYIWVDGAEFILDRWWRRYARKHPQGRFIHGATTDIKYSPAKVEKFKKRRAK